MRYKLISCDVFLREICLCVGSSPHVFDLEFTAKGDHDRSDELRASLQRRIDAAEAGPTRFDAVLLAFGLCGNSTAGLTARSTPLVLPRAHDCCTLFLGSRGAFREHFADNPSRPFTSAGYMERGGSWARPDTHLGDPAGAQAGTPAAGGKYEEYVLLYGEENARYIIESLEHSDAADGKFVFIDIPELSHLGHLDRFRAQASADGREPVVLRGDLRLLRKLTLGDWDPEEFLVVPPGGTIQPVYDWNEVVRAR